MLCISFLVELEIDDKTNSDLLNINLSQLWPKMACFSIFMCCVDRNQAQNSSLFTKRFGVERHHQFSSRPANISATQAWGHSFLQAMMAFYVERSCGCERTTVLRQSAVCTIHTKRMEFVKAMYMLPESYNVLNSPYCSETQKPLNQGHVIQKRVLSKIPYSKTKEQC